MPKLIVPFFILISMGGWSQSKTMIYVDGRLSEEEVFGDSIALKNYIESTKIRWINEGFLFSGFDSLSLSSKTPKVYLHKGNVSDLSIEGIKGRKVEKSLTKLSRRYSNSGYPFAQIRVDSITYENNFLLGYEILSLFSRAFKLMSGIAE